MSKYSDAAPLSPRVIVFVSGGVADVVSDKVVSWELVDWDSMRAGNGWTYEDIAVFTAWADGLISASVVERLRLYAKPTPDEKIGTLKSALKGLLEVVRDYKKRGVDDEPYNKAIKAANDAIAAAEDRTPAPKHDT